MTGQTAEETKPPIPNSLSFSRLDGLHIGLNASTFREMVEQGKLSHVTLGKKFLDELIKDIEEIRSKIPWDTSHRLDELAFEDVKASSANKIATKVELTTDNAEAVYRFLRAASDLDLITTYDGEDVLTIYDEDRNFFSGIGDVDDMSTDNPITYFEYRMTEISKPMPKEQAGVNRAGIAREWALLRTVYAANKVGLIPLKGQRAPSTVT